MKPEMGVLSVLEPQEKENEWFVPHLFGFRLRQYLSVVKQLRCSEKNFVLKEDFLMKRNYLFVWTHVFRIRTKKIALCKFQGEDLTCSVYE